MQQALKSAFGLMAREETREVDVRLLRVKEPGARGLPASATPGESSRSGPGFIGGVNFAIAGLASALEGRLNTVVIDETGLTNRYDISLKWDEKSEIQPNREGMVKALRKELGFELVPARRPVKMLVVELVKRGIMPNDK